MVQLGELVMILDLHRQGLSVTAIARQLSLDRKTVRKYIARGLKPQAYAPRPPREHRLDLFTAYLRERVAAHPALTGSRLWREIKERGYEGGYTAVTDFLRGVRPTQPAPFEVRFETPAAQQAQVDFARFVVTFADEPGATRIVWLFSMVLGHSRHLWARFVLHQDLQTVLRCHIAAFADLGGVPAEILYDRMKTAVTGEGEDGHIVYNRSLVALAAHYGFLPRACRPYRAKTKGKVERPFRYVREDFFLARSFRDLDDLNAQLADWLGTVANVRRHATTQRVVAEAFGEERSTLRPLPAVPFRAVLRLERRVMHEGLVSVGGNLYSVPDRTRRVVEVHQFADEIQILDAGRLVAVHALVEGRRQALVAPGHRRRPELARRTAPGREGPIVIGRAGEHVARRSLDIYAAVGRRLAKGGRP